MIAEKEKVSSFGLADLSPLGRKAVYRMSDLDPTVLQCINMSGLYRTIWNEIGEYATDRRMETVLVLERRTEFCADTFECEKSSLRKSTLSVREPRTRRWNPALSGSRLNAGSAPRLPSLRGFHLT